MINKKLRKYIEQLAKNEAFDEYAFYGGMPLILSRPNDTAKIKSHSLQN